MTNVNSVNIIGRLTADIDSVQGGFSYLNGTTALAKVSVAVNRSRKNGDQWVDEVSFFNVAIWGKTAENLHKYLKKGTKVAVKGYLKQDRWKDKNGQSRSSVSIVAEQVELCGSGDGQNKDPSGAGTANAGAPGVGGAAAPRQSAMPETDFPEDIPF